MNGDVDTFQQLVGKMPYRPKAIFPSEMFLFYKLAKDFGPKDHIIESGVGYGGSTSYLVRLFPFTRITAVDADRYRQFGKLKQQFKTVELIRGNSLRLLPAIVRRSNGERIAILIDGPKRQPAINLANKLLEANTRVRFVAVHDLSVEMAKQGTFNSKDEAFQKQFGFLDKDVGPYRNIYPSGPGLTIFGMAPC